MRSNIARSLIRDAILSGRLAPGEPIRQEQFARESGTSRIPVREALRQLESEGLVTFVPNAGAKVSQLKAGELQGIYRLREAIEPMLIAASAKHQTEASLAELAELVEDIETSANEPESWLIADRRFHLATYRYADMERVQTLTEQFWNSTQHFRRANISSLQKSGFDILHMEHRVLLDALRRRSSEDAADCIRMHIRRTRLNLSAHSELFGSN